MTTSSRSTRGASANASSTTAISASLKLSPPETLEAQTRFHHLLRPFRELADNWNIELAEDLIEYVRQELEGIEGASAVNFAQAALLVQNSAMVYSKKVESLYDLILKALERLSAISNDKPSQASKQQQQRNNQDEEAVEDDDDVEYSDYDEDFDDFRVLPERIPEEATTRRYVMKSSSSLSEANVGLAPAAPPDMLVANAGFSTGSSTNRGALVFNLCKSNLVDPFSGALLLDRNIFSPLSGTTESTHHQLSSTGDASCPPSSQNDLQVSDPMADDSFHNDDDAGGVDDVGGFNDGYYPSGTDQASSYPFNKPTKEKKKQLSWGDLIDPNIPSVKRKDKPFKKGRCYTHPGDDKLTLNDETSRGGDVLLEPISIPLLSLVLDSRRPDTVRSSRQCGLDRLAFPEFEPVVKARRKQLKKLTGRGRSNVSSSSHLGGTGTGDGYDYGDGGNDDDYDHEDMDGGGGGLGGDGGWGEGNSNQNNSDQGDSFTLTREPETMIPESYAEVVRAHVARFLETARNWATESRLTMRVRGWHDHLEPILKEQESRPSFNLREYEAILVNEFESTNEKRSFESLVEMAQELKVGSNEPSLLTNQMMIRVESQDEDENYNPSLLSYGKASHVYSENPNGMMTTRWQVCRIFLTTLVLANQGAVQIESHLGDHQCASEMEFETRSSEGMDVTFIAVPKHMKSTANPAMKENNSAMMTKSANKKGRKHLRMSGGENSVLSEKTNLLLL